VALIRRNRLESSISNVFKSIAVLIFISAPALGAGFIPVEDPDAFASGVVMEISTHKLAEAAKVIADQMGKPEAAATLGNAFKVFDGKTFDLSSKVMDKEYNNVLRQIVHYSYIKDLGFVYFRFNFKKASNGWILANFTFKDETNELFPKDFIER